jgi:5'-deoxynucleotidase YfbR-like HD superfamily hydrolase
VEVYADDTSTFAPQEALDSKAEREETALKHIKNEFAHFPWIAQTIEEYESRSTNEAKFVYALDKYIVLTYRYIDEGKSLRECQLTLETFNKKLEAHRKKAQSHPEIAKYYEEVRALFDSHPEFFHVDR